MRKIKLMALLLAALMVMSAFAGCASGVKDDVADLNDRIDAIEDKLDGLGDNKDVLDAIESMGKDLNDKIDDLNGRVDAVETPDAGATTTPAAVKAAIETALININVKSAEFAKNINEYSEADYVKIVEALGAAKAAVNTAATEADVAAAIAALDATLKNYMTYAMRMYDYYTKLLGNLVDVADEDTKALVEEAKAFIKAVDKVDGITAADLIYVVNEKYPDDPAKNIDTYASVKALCNIFEKTTGTYAIDYVNAKGKLVKGASFATLKSFADTAKRLVKDINGVAGDEVLYSNLSTYAASVAALETRYEAFADDAAIIGGDALVATVENVDKLVEILDAVDNLKDAAYAFGRYVDRKSISEVMPTETAIIKNIGTAADPEYVFVADLYAEAVAELDAWADEYGLSEANKKAIYGAGYDDIAKNVRIVELKMAAYDKFAADIAPAIVALNDGADKTSAAAVDYIAVQEMVKDILVYLKADKNNSDLDKAILGTNKELALTNADLADIALMAEIYDEEVVATKVAALKTAAADVKKVKDYAIKFFSFVDDEDTEEVDEAAALETYFTVTVDAINTEIEYLNNAIKDLAEKVADYNITSVEDFMILSGEYVTLDKLLEGKTFKAANGDAVAANAAYYVLVSDIDTDDFKTSAVENATIAAFLNGTYVRGTFNVGELTKDFAELIKVDVFNDAWKALEESVTARFDDAAAIVAAVDAIDYIRGTNVKFYTDDNNNGKYDTTDALVVGPTNGLLVNLNAKDSVNAAKDKYDAWVLAGGRLNLEKLVEAENANEKSYGNVYTFVDLRSTEDSLEAAINLIGDLSDDIKELNTMYTKLVKLIDGVVAADKYTKFEVSKNGDSYINVFGTLPSRNDYSIKYFAITGFTKTNDKEDVGIYDGTFSYVNKTTGNIDTKGYNGPQTESESGSAVKTFLASNVTTKKDLAQAVVNAYDAYAAANLEVVADAANDYEGTDPVYYAVKGIAANDTVKAKLDTYLAFDLLRAKGEIVIVYGSSTDNAAKNLVSQVVAATSFAQIVSAVKNYNDISETDYALANLNAVIINDVK